MLNIIVTLFFLSALIDVCKNRENLLLVVKEAQPI